MELSSAKSTANSQRVLAAIVITDAVGFSARMSIDEETTLCLIQRDLKMMGELCEQYNGQVLKSTGDGLLMSFSSAVHAVSCSQDIQTQLLELAKDSPSDEALQHRIGVHLGDVLFSHSDVLGNGVNIAARLQTQSVPGGICMSQTIYDVVKARLDLNAIFLGPLRLKNIHEPVPAYQIPPVGEPLPTHPQEPLTQWGNADPIQGAVTQLQQDANQWRIKKLIYGTCKNSWANDAAVLEQFPLEDLVRTLFQRYPSLDTLQAAFNGVVARLNRQGEYLAVSSRILAILQPVYDQQAQDDSATSMAPGNAGYQRIATRLDTSNQAVRIKKLLYAVTTDTWENNVVALTQHRLDLLVAAAHRMAPTPEDLKRHLGRIVKRLNRQEHYVPVADAIMNAFQPLYGGEDEGTQFASGDGVTAMAIPEDTEYDSELTDGLSTVTRAQTLETGEDGITVYDPESSDAKAQNSPLEKRGAIAGSRSAYGGQPRDRNNLFDLRQEIMRYTPPLRAKILLFSTIRSPFTFSHQDWLSLKEKTLDDLIQDIFHYCPQFSDLESKLVIISHCLDNPQENTQAAGAILQAMKPYYPA